MNNVTRHKDTMTGEYQSEREADIKHIFEGMDGFNICKTISVSC